MFPKAEALLGESGRGVILTLKTRAFTDAAKDPGASCIAHVHWPLYEQPDIPVDLTC